MLKSVSELPKEILFDFTLLRVSIIRGTRSKSSSFFSLGHPRCLKLLLLHLIPWNRIWKIYHLLLLLLVSILIYHSKLPEPSFSLRPVNYSLLLILIHKTHRLYQESLCLLCFTHCHEIFVEFLKVLANVARVMVGVGRWHVHPQIQNAASFTLFLESLC
jgi:hypothetical protein